MSREYFKGAHLWRCSWFDVLGISIDKEKIKAESPLTKMSWAGVHTLKHLVWHKVLISGRSEVWAKINTVQRLTVVFIDQLLGIKISFGNVNIFSVWWLSWIFFAQTWLCFIMSGTHVSVFFFFFNGKLCILKDSLYKWCSSVPSTSLLCYFFYGEVTSWGFKRRFFFVIIEQYTKPGLSIIIISKVCNEISILGFGIWLCYFTSKHPVYFQPPFLVLLRIFISKFCH